MKIQTPRSNQSGAALVVSLLVLLVMTMLGLAAVQTNVLEEKMAGNMHDKQLAFQAAEAALRIAEDAISNNFSDNQVVTCEGGNDVVVSATHTAVCHTLDAEPDAYVHSTWSTAANYTALQAADFNTFGEQTPPKYFITFVDKRNSGLTSLGMGGGKQKISADTFYFRITARGTGGSDNAQSVLRSYFAR